MLGGHSPRTLNVEPLEVRLNLATCADAVNFEPESVERAVHTTNCFAADLYEELDQEPGNILFSPLSITTALAMTYAGADGTTAEKLRDALHLSDEPGIHEAFSNLLAEYELPRPGSELVIGNSMWPHESFPFHEEFLATIRSKYSAASQALNYEDPEAAKNTINRWVELQTRGKIKDLIAELHPLTRMVLTNAIYFKTSWLTPFNEFSTQRRRFTLKDDSRVQVQMMSKLDEFPYTEIGGFQVLALKHADSPKKEFDPNQPVELDGDFFPTAGRTSMVFILPKSGSIDDLDTETMSQIDDWLDRPRRSTQAVHVSIPRFSTGVATDLKPLLANLGLAEMFEPGAADFSNMTDDPSFHIMQALHKADLSVDENGIEAAAATAIVGGIICFAAGTPIITENGAKSIEDIKVGDFVLSRNEHSLTGELGLRKVQETFKSETELVHVYVGGQVIRTTGEHPFFVQGRGWTTAAELQSGDQLATDLSSWREVERVEATGKHESVYNFRVAEHHTYFVGCEDWGFAVWAHNCCCSPEAEFRADRPFRFLIRDDDTGATLFMGRIDNPLETENTLRPAIARSTEAFPGDTDGDEDVDFHDFLVLSENFGRTTDAAFAAGDFDSDGTVTFEDFLILQNNYGRHRETPG